MVFTLTYGLTQTTVLRATADEIRAGTGNTVTIDATALGGLPTGTRKTIAATPGVPATATAGATTVLWPTGPFGDTTSAATRAQASRAAPTEALAVR